MFLNVGEELLRYLGNGNVIDVYLSFLYLVEKKVKRAFELLSHEDLLFFPVKYQIVPVVLQLLFPAFFLAAVFFSLLGEHLFPQACNDFIHKFRVVLKIFDRLVTPLSDLLAVVGIP